MRWRVLVELTGGDGSVSETLLATGESAGPCHTAATLGLTLTEGKTMVAALQQIVVKAQAAEHCAFRRRCTGCGALRPVKDHRPRKLITPCGIVTLRAPRLSRCRCGVACRRSITPVAEIMPDRCTPEYERILALMGSSLPYRQARALMGELLPLTEAPDVETVRQRTLRTGARLEQAALAAPASPLPMSEGEIVLSIDGGHVRSVKTYQQRSFEIMLGRVTGADGQERVFSSLPAEADQQTRQLRNLLVASGATSNTPVAIVSDGAEGPRQLGQSAAPGPTRHVLDWFHLSMRVQHAAQAVAGWMTAAPDNKERLADLARAVESVRWRLWHGQAQHALTLIGETLEGLADQGGSAQANKVIKLLSGLETYVAGNASMIIDYATTRRQSGPISTATTESTVQRLLHRRMGASQQMRWSPRGAHLMLKVRTSVMNGAFTRDHAAAERFARRPYRLAA
jgi:hypothetical protein